MDKRNKNKTGDEDDFLRYISGEMTGEERNAFEKELQKDPFAGEAAEGFTMLTEKEATKDLSVLKKKVDKRTGRRTVTIRYRIAAAAAILVAVSVIFFNRNTEQEPALSKNYSEEVNTPLVIAASEPVIAKSEKPPEKSELRRTIIPVSPPQPVSPSPDSPDNKQLAVYSELNDVVEAEEKADTELIPVAEDYNMAQPVEAEKKVEMSEAAGISTRMAAKSSLREHTSPQPVTGIDSFNIYLEKNIRNPEPGSGKEEVVIISFTVKPDSTIGDIRIIESPGQAYSNEAKRLIKDGPMWKPAFGNGVPVKEEYRLRIVFR